MPDSLDIAEVARLTGLTSRALRFYEARGLVTPLRTASGRRHYGPAELERLHQIVAMKRAGLTLAQIQAMTAARRIDLRRIVAAQVELAPGGQPLDLREREAGALHRHDLVQPLELGRPIVTPARGRAQRHDQPARFVEA